MQYLETFLQKQAQIVATSFILGLIFGASYDIIRINHILCSIVSYDGGKRKTKRGVVPFLILFFTDLLWMLLIGAAFSLWVYRVNDGAFRWFIAAGTVAGFAVWHETLGRVVLFFAEKIASTLQKLVSVLVWKPLSWIGRLIGRIAVGLWRHTGERLIGQGKRRRALRKTERLRQALRQDLSFGEEG